MFVLHLIHVDPFRSFRSRQIIQGEPVVEVDRSLDQQRVGDCRQVEIHLDVRLGLVDHLRVGHELAGVLPWSVCHCGLYQAT